MADSKVEEEEKEGEEDEDEDEDEDLYWWVVMVVLVLSFEEICLSLYEEHQNSRAAYEDGWPSPSPPRPQTFLSGSHPRLHSGLCLVELARIHTCRCLG